MMRSGILIILMAVSGLATGAPEDRVRQVLSSLREDIGFPGATLAWIGPDAEVHTLAVGLADPYTGTPMKPDSRMLAASIGKSFVAAAVLSAAEDGRLDLDTPISHWLGDRTWFPRLPNHQSLTLRYLLSHTGGLPDHVYLPAFEAMFRRSLEGRDTPGPEELIGLILDAEPLFEPGMGWAYSDTGYLLAARVLEAETGCAWTHYIRTHFLEPLDLKATIPSDRRHLARLATGITSADNALGLPERTVDEHGQLVWDPAVEDAGGGFVSTAGNLARWGWLLWSGRLHSDGSSRAMVTGVPVDEARPGVTYGLGVVIEQSERYGEVRGHRGWIPGYVSSLQYYPDYDTAIALQVNSDIGMRGEKGGIQQIEDRITQAILTKGAPE